MIKQVRISGIPKYKSVLSIKFNEDINIITGRNGAGKTTILKLIWCVVSGNIEWALREVPFNWVHIETSDYEIIVHKLSPIQCRVKFIKNGEEFLFEDSSDEDFGEDAEDKANDAVKSTGSSVFFPTFRRIEGGFSLNYGGASPSFRATSRNRTDIEESLLSLSRRLTVEKHTFVASISTVDIVSLLMRNYTEMSEIANNTQKNASQNIMDQIKSYKRDAGKSGEQVAEKAEDLLDSIRAMIEELDKERTRIMSPLDAVRSLVEKLFAHSGIKLGARLSFGDAANAISSDMLSAGEKQMLSFICYNAFYKGSIIFIDEPELSLHVDWQRQLFPTLLGQGTSNQFIVSTHSPFIYSKYPEKEILLGEDRGASSEEIE